MNSADGCCKTSINWNSKQTPQDGNKHRQRICVCSTAPTTTTTTTTTTATTTTTTTTTKNPPGWYVSDSGRHCLATCLPLGLTCKDRDQLIHNNEIDSTWEMYTILHEKGFSCETFDTRKSMGSRAAVPNINPSDNACIPSAECR